LFDDLTIQRPWIESTTIFEIIEKSLNTTKGNAMRRLWFSATGIGDAASVVIILVLALLFFVNMAHAQQQQMCAPFDEMRETLASQFHETEVGTGMVSDTEVLMLYASPGGETWTILGLNVSGIACIKSAGKGWDAGRLPAAGERDA
jgi:hypothetical protein